MMGGSGGVQKSAWLLLLLLNFVLSSRANEAQLHDPLYSQAKWKATKKKGDQEHGDIGVTMRGIGRLGSRPPSCEHKCAGCVPCEAIQVPTTTGRLEPHQYTNYEPEGWKCKCGSTFYNP